MPGKTFSNILSNILTLSILFLYSELFKEIKVNILGLIGSVILVALFHSFIGFVLTYYSKDFTELLIGMIKYKKLARELRKVVLDVAGMISRHGELS